MALNQPSVLHYSLQIGDGEPKNHDATFQTYDDRLEIQVLGESFKLPYQYFKDKNTSQVDVSKDGKTGQVDIFEEFSISRVDFTWKPDIRRSKHQDLFVSAIDMSQITQAVKMAIRLYDSNYEDMLQIHIHLQENQKPYKSRESAIVKNLKAIYLTVAWTSVALVFLSRKAA